MIENEEGQEFKTVTWANFGMFPGWVGVSSGYDYEELQAYFKKKRLFNRYGLVMKSHEEMFSRNNNGFAIYQEIQDTKTKEIEGLYFVVLRHPYDFSDEAYITLAHELIHIVQFFAPTVFDRNTERESEAYLHTHLMRQCLAAFRLGKTGKTKFQKEQA